MTRRALDNLDPPYAIFFQTKDIARRMQAVLNVGKQFLLVQLLPAKDAQLFASLVTLLLQLDHALGCVAGRAPRTRRTP